MAISSRLGSPEKKVGNHCHRGGRGSIISGFVTNDGTLYNCLADLIYTWFVVLVNVWPFECPLAFERERRRMRTHNLVSI